MFYKVNKCTSGMSKSLIKSKPCGYDNQDTFRKWPPSRLEGRILKTAALVIMLSYLFWLNFTFCEEKPRMLLQPELILEFTFIGIRFFLAFMRTKVSLCVLDGISDLSRVYRAFTQQCSGEAPAAPWPHKVWNWIRKRMDGWMVSGIFISPVAGGTD